jgi:hypothetical protein
MKKSYDFLSGPMINTERAVALSAAVRCAAAGIGMNHIVELHATDNRCLFNDNYYSDRHIASLKGPYLLLIVSEQLLSVLYWQLTIRGGAWCGIV